MLVRRFRNPGHAAALGNLNHAELPRFSASPLPAAGGLTLSGLSVQGTSWWVSL